MEEMEDMFVAALPSRKTRKAGFIKTWPEKDIA